MAECMRVENVTKRFGDVVALDRINISFERGKIYGIIGRNGSGKTVLFKTMIGYLKPTSGRIVVGEREIGKDIDFLPELGVLIEKPGFIENYTQFENLKYLAQINNTVHDEDIKATLEMVGLNPDNNEKVKNFSLGMRQRLAIAQAIMEKQKIIILDEPFNGLDKQGVVLIKQLLLELKAPDRLILLTSHIAGDIEELSDSVFEFSAGRIVPVNL